MNTYYIQKNKELTTYVKYNNFWWELNTDTPIEYATLYNEGGSHLIGINISKCEIVEAKDKYNLNWQKTDVYNNNYQTGWLSPKGIFYGCEFHCHSLQAKYIHKTGEHNLELKGFIRLTYINNNRKNLYAFLGQNYNFEYIKPTYKQFIYLKNNNIFNFEEVKCLIKHAKLLYENINTKDF